MRQAIGFAIYLGIGAMLHALFVGPQFDWQSAWTFGWLLGWPIMIFIVSWGFIIGAIIVCVVCWLGWLWLETIAHWLERRRKRRRI